jgi:3-oxoacyl-[acyl-carrier protein] reductase
VDEHRHDQRLDGRVALVTGAGGDIGSAIGSELARLGASIVCAGRRRRPLENLAVAIERAGGSAALLTLDVRDKEQCRLAPAAAVELCGGLDILVNNAGVSSTGAADDATAEEFEEVLATDLTGPFLLTRFAADHMGAGGCVVNIGSIMGTVAMRGLTSYAAAKGGLLQLTRQSALDLASRGIRVNLVAPGFIAGTMFEESHPEERRRHILSLHPLARLGTAHDVAAAVAFLASDGASFITGTSLVVDGGLSLQVGIDQR